MWTPPAGAITGELSARVLNGSIRNRNQRSRTTCPIGSSFGASALRRTETGAGEGERREHALLQQRFVGFAGNRLGDMADDGVADVGVREALAAGGLGFRGKNSGDEAAPRRDQFFGCLGPGRSAPCSESSRGAGGVGQQMMQRADAPAARHFDVGQQCGQRVVQGQPPVVFEHGEQRGRHRLGDRPDVPAVVDVHRNARTPPALAAGGRPGKLPVGHHGSSHPGVSPVSACNRATRASRRAWTPSSTSASLHISRGGTRSGPPRSLPRPRAS